MKPQMSDLSAKASGEPLQMRGLMHVLSSNYTEGMSLDELQIAVGSVIKKQIQESLQNLDASSIQVVMSFLQSVDYTLTIDNNKEIRSGRSM